jgi:UDPglucose--hexose-1-phosphate uridylyltransferase
MKKLNLIEHTHRRLNILTGEWILVSPHRTMRPWQGKLEKTIPENKPHYDSECYLCPGNARVNSARNPDYTKTFVFDNDFSALLPDTVAADFNDRDLLVAKSEQGICRVVCFSQRHDLTLAEMGLKDVRAVVDVWTDEYRELGSRDNINYVQIFENKGEIMGCSNPHPHGQIWAQSTIPTEPAKETAQMKKYFQSHRSCLLCDYTALELRRKERVVCENREFAVVVPYWAVWPFETMIIPKDHVRSLIEMSAHARDMFADILKRTTVRYDNLFGISFPYSAGIHQSPTDGNEHPEWHFHMHFYPPLLRSASVKKFMVGYEMLANPQRDVSAEFSAERLRQLSEIHYRKRKETNSR